MGLADEYAARFAASRTLFDRARAVIPGGVSHESRRLEPFPPYIARAEGSMKWDVGGNEIIDYVLGHAALILGHSHPDIVAAIGQQASLMTHPGASHALEVEWAEWISRLVPSAEAVRFVMSGTEATLLALRVARAHTGRSVVARVDGHFHGWHDYVVGTRDAARDGSASGVPDSVRSGVRVARLNDAEDLEAMLLAEPIAAVILEPEGARSGTVPPPAGYLERVRKLTKETGALLIFDEVVSGFRVSPGGAQALVRVIPDMTTLAKTVAGGLPGGAVVGRRDVMDVLTYGHPKYVAHQGTWNANPLAAVAGITCLSMIADGRVTELVNSSAERLRIGLNQAFARAGVPGFAFGQNSAFRVIFGEDLPTIRDTSVAAEQQVQPSRLLKGIPQPLGWAVQQALLMEGIDFMRGDHGWLSSAHTLADLDATIAGFSRALDRLVESKVVRPVAA